MAEFGERATVRAEFVHQPLPLHGDVARCLHLGDPTFPVPDGGRSNPARTLTTYRLKYTFIIKLLHNGGLFVNISPPTASGWA